MINTITIIGNVGTEPIVRENNGKKLVRFTVATNEQYKDKDGVWQSDTQWHTCYTVGKLVDGVLKYVKKGTQVYIQGKMVYRRYVDANGVNRRVGEVFIRFIKRTGNNITEQKPYPKSPTDF